MGEWLERELEDYIVAHPRELCATAFMYFTEDVSVLGRQVRCQYGIIDVLLWVHSETVSHVLVVECKAVHEKGLAVEQVTRYQSAIEFAGIYDNLPSDAFPEYGTNNHGWAHHIEIVTHPVLVAPSFDKKLVSTFHGSLVTAQKIDGGFSLASSGGRLYTDGQGQLNDALAPVIRRAQTDAKAKHITEALRNGFPSGYRYSAN
jgi:hypothetical protein